MTAYIVRRLFTGIIMLIVMSMVTFVLFFSSPVNPEDFACGKNCSVAQKEQTRKAEAEADKAEKERDREERKDKGLLGGVSDSLSGRDRR